MYTYGGAYTWWSILYTVERTQGGLYVRWRRTYSKTCTRWSVYMGVTQTRQYIHMVGLTPRGHLPRGYIHGRTFTWRGYIDRKTDKHTEKHSHGGDIYTKGQRRDIHMEEYIHGGTYTQRGHKHEGGSYTEEIYHICRWYELNNQVL